MHMDLDLVAGFIDADGSLSMTLERAPENRFGYRRKLVFTITNKDKAVLDQAQAVLGFGRVEATNKPSVSKASLCYTLRTDSHKDAERIVCLFERRVHGSAKLEIPLWKEGLNLCKSSQTADSYIHFVCLMYGINSQGVLRRKPISFWLDVFGGKEDSSYVDTVRARAVKSLPMNGSYVSGYCQGDGSFYLSNRKRFTTSWSLTDGDRGILDQIQRFLLPDSNCVSSSLPRTSQMNKEGYRLKIDRFERCRTVVVPHFDSYPVFGIQKERYLLWREAVILTENRATRSKDRIAEICELLRLLK